MSGGGGPKDHHQQPPQQQPFSDGEFLLRLLQNRQQPPPPSHNLSLDPAVSSVGLSHTITPPPWPHHFSPAPPSFRSAPHHHFGNFNLPSSSHATPSSLNNSHLHASSGNFINNVKDLNFGQGFDLLNKRDLGFGVGGSVPNGFDSNRRIDPNSSSNVQGNYNYNNMKDVNFGQGFDLLKERDLGFGGGGSMPNGFGSDRRIDPNSSPNAHAPHGNFNYNSNNNNMRDLNLGQGFDLLKERELGFGLGSNMRNGVGSDRRISTPSHARGGYNYDNIKVSSLGQGFDLLKERDLGYDRGGNMRNGMGSDRRIDPRMNWANSPPEPRRSGPPPGFSGSNLNQRRSDGDLYNVGREIGGSSEFSREMSSNHRGFSGTNEKSYDGERRFLRLDDAVGVRGGGGGLSRQLDHPGLPAGTAHHSVLGSDVEQSLKVLHGGEVDNEVSHDEVDELSERLVDSVLEDGPSDEKNELNGVKKHPRDKDFRSDARGKWILPQRTRNSKRMIECRRDIHRLSAPFLAIYKSLIPPEEEKLKQKQLMSLLEKLVSKEWPNAKLYLYGSCANSFGVSKSDIDVCLAIDDQDINKSEILLKLAEILESDNLQNVQALTRARVPIVKLMDPVTGISCDICINNVLAVVNTKLLRDYAEIDGRLRQLAFLVKYWAKSRGVNETYQGTLSSYAYVLMCIHFLQQRSPPILPCLQGMKATYAVVVDQTECSFFDQVEKLHDFGAQNKENIAQLIWGFFSYWAYGHDYANTVISVRTGNILSKHEKDWTRRVGNDRHLICIEDPFEVTHDLGRVVDKHSIRVLREEFERAAWIMQNDPNPCATLFEPYVPAS